MNASLSVPIRSSESNSKGVGTGLAECVGGGAIAVAPGDRTDYLRPFPRGRQSG